MVQASSSNIIDLISEYDSKKKYQSKTAPASAFLFKCNADIPANLYLFEMEVLKRLSSKVFTKWYISELINQEYCRQWMRILLDTPTEEWSKCLLNDTLDEGGADQSEEVCQAI